MTSLAFFIEKIALGLYILSAGGILLMMHRLYRAQRDLTVAQFKLEREHALVRKAGAITWGGLFIEFLIGVWAVANMAAPTLRDIRLGANDQSAKQPKQFVTSTPASNPPFSFDTGGSGDQGPVIFATQPPTATPVGTIIPDAPDSVGCSRESAWLLVPGNGQRIFESTIVFGTANISNFAFYRFEIKPVTAGAQFAPMGNGDFTTPVIEGPLGEISPLNFAYGEYRFRLTVFDNTNTLRALCEVTIHITEPPLTPTPIIAGTPAVIPTPQ
jgi:hypothetical protein